MKKFSQAFLFLISALATSFAFGQGEITISEITGGVSGSPIPGGTNDIAVFGISFDKAGGAISDITQIIIQLSAGAGGKFSNPRLYRSNNTNFDGIGSETLVSNGAIGTAPDVFTFDGTPITDFSVSGTPQTTAETRNFFIVVNVSPAANGTTPSIQPAISEVDITAATTVSANSINGTTYSFTGITPNITSVGPGSSTCVGETITITGTGFSGPTVTINGVTATINSSNATQIQITAPGGAAIGTNQITVENSNGNSANSTNYTINPMVDLLKTVLPSNANPASGTQFFITISNTQPTVEYRVVRTSPTMGTSTGYQNGNNGVLMFGPFSHTNPNTYTYTAYARSTNCGTEQALNQTASVTVAALQANAGSNVTICAGETVTLGGNPTASGGTGFYNVTWTSPTDPTFVSIESNPVVNPYTTTTYQVEVRDSDSDTDTDLITVTVKDAADEIDLNIDLTPNGISFNKNDGPVDLDYSNVGPTTHQAHTFSGDGVVTSQEKFYPNFANIGENVITMDFTNTNNCTTTISKTITVYDPSSFVTSLNANYCPVGTDNFTIIIPPSPAYPYNYVSFIDVAITDSFGNPVPEGSNWSHAGQTVTINPGAMGADRYTILITYSKNNWQIIGSVPGCPEVYTCFIPTFPFFSTCVRYNCLIPIFGAVPTNVQEKVEFTIRENPKVTIRKIVKSLPFETCLNSDSVRVEGFPTGGIWSGPGIKATVGNDNNASFSGTDNGVAYFNPANANPGGFNVFTYTFEDEFGCSTSTSDSIMVFNIPSIDYSVGNGCVGIPLPFQPTVTIPPGVFVSNYRWDFNDNTVTDSTAVSAPTIHTYASSNTYDVSFATRTSDGCVVAIEKEIQVGDIPDVDINWNNVCDQDPTRFVIRSDFFKNTPSLVDQVQWDFGDGTPPDVNTSPTISDTINFHLYSSLGTYPIQATLTSDLGCTRSKVISAYKVPKVAAVSDLNEYFRNFNDSNHGWIAGGENTSWEWGIPADTTIISNGAPMGSSWVTNLAGSYSENEKSWVHSPCFDLTQIERPVISFDFRSLTREQLDGAVLQINTTNTTNVESAWKNVGVIGSGKNWFNKAGIFANPGNQNLLQSGWSGEVDTVSWREAIYALDNELPMPGPMRERVRFRFAFASLSRVSNDTLPEGFAFDNVKISERDRIVLLETFTNAGGNNTPTEPNKVANQTINSNLVSETELIKIEYHVGIGGPGIDSLYLHNRQDANARAAYYGITATPFAFLDSKSGNLGNLFAEQKLASAAASIDTIITDASLGENIEVRFTPKVDLDSNTVLRIVVVEKNISYIAPNGEIDFTYVMKQMLPNATGIKYETNLVANNPMTGTVYWPPPSKIYNGNELAIIAFLQNDLTREVYQAKILSTLNYNPYPDANLITAIEPDFINQIRVFPSPADEALTVLLPASLPQQIPVKLYDAYGREIYNSSFGSGDRSKTITTKNIAAGIYILQLDSKEGPLLRKKVLVVH